MSKTDQFIIRLSNEKIPIYRIFSILIAVLCAASMLLISRSLNKNDWEYMITHGSFGNLMGALISWFIFKKDKNWVLRYIIAATLIAGIGFVVLGYGLGGLVIALSILGLKSIKTPIIQCTNDGIIYPSFFSKNISWKEVEMMQIKDGILTLDLKNNQLLQFTLNEKDNPDLNEEELNDFVRKCK